MRSAACLNDKQLVASTSAMITLKSDDRLMLLHCPLVAKISNNIVLRETGPFDEILSS